MNVSQKFAQAQDALAPMIAAIKPEQLELPTPDTEWNVRALLNHITGENLWVPELLAGKTITEVGDKFDGDILGANPPETWKQASLAATEAAQTADLSSIVHLSFGDNPASDYLEQLFIDTVVHGWDMSSALGVDYPVGLDLVEDCYQLLLPQAEGWRQSGAFGSKIEVAESAGTLDKLMGLTGRDPSWHELPH